MNGNVRQAATWRRPTAGYYASLGFALVGIVFVAMGIGGSLDARAGVDAFDALDHAGLPALIFVWFLLYAFRLIFWGRVSPHVQNLVRNALTLLLCIEVAAAAVALFLMITAPDAPPLGGSSRTIMIVCFTVPAVLCQIATLTWLIRYRKE